MHAIAKMFFIHSFPLHCSGSVHNSNISMAKLVKLIGEKAALQFIPKHFDDLADGLLAIRRQKLTKICGDRSYYLTGILAKMERALVNYTTSFLLSRGFQMVSVPDIFRPTVLEACGVAKGDHNVVYKLHPRHGEWSLSGTAEMALAALYQDRKISVQNDKKLCAVSRCYRAEVTDTQEGLYRVHEFTKVEMFGYCSPSRSVPLLEEFLQYQIEIVESLGLHAQILDMPKEELGLPAVKKYDIEAWMPGHKKYGEITSCSNCTDYQSSRLNILSEEDGEPVHTVNGTACAVPRMLIALLEQHQQMDGALWIPPVLRKYLGGEEIITKPARESIGIAWKSSRKTKPASGKSRVTA